MVVAMVVVVVVVVVTRFQWKGNYWKLGATTMEGGQARFLE